MTDARSTSLPDWLIGNEARSECFRGETPTEPVLPSCQEEAGGGPDSTSPIAKLLMVLQALLNGTPVDMAAVKWLWMRVANGDFTSGAFPSHAPRIALRNMEKDVGACLALMLGPTHTRRGSKHSDVESASVWPSRYGRTCSQGRGSGGSSIEMSQAQDMADLMSEFDDMSQDEEPLWTITATPVPEVETCLRSAGSWGFDAFKLAEVTQGHPLSALGFWVLNTTGVVQDMGLDPQRLVNYLRRLDRCYTEPSIAPYHNSTHASDVLQQMHMLLTAGGLAEVASKREHLTQLAAYLAAIVHDVDHQAVNNDFLIRTEDRLALLYNDNSPQENHHAATAFQLLRQPECNFLRGMSKDRKAKLRQMVITMVLATDMKMHVGLFSAFKSKVDVQKMALPKLQPVASSSRRTSAPGESKDPGRKRSMNDMSMSSLFPNTDTGRALVMQIALKCADLGHASAPWDVHMQWVTCLEQEMFLQGDKEAAANLPISSLMDRSRDGVSKSQCDFLDMVALPLFQVWACAFPGASPMVRNTEANLERWKAQRAARAKLGRQG